MAKVKVKLLTSRAGMRMVPYTDLRPARDEDGNWLYDKHGAHVMEEYEREQEEGFANNAGEEIEVDADEAERLVSDGQAELVGKARAKKAPAAKKAASRKRQPRRPKAETAEAPAKGESRSKKSG